MMPLYTDQLNRTIELHKPPQKIISLVPSQTELLHDLGLEEEIIGITRFCVHPDRWFKTKTRIGGTKQLQIKKIKELKPDLIIANKEENEKDQIEELAKDFPVWISDVNNLEDALKMIGSVGELLHKQIQAQNLVSQIKLGFSQLKTKNFRLSSAYLIWRKPYMTVGGDTFIHDMMMHAGVKNIFEDRSRYPQIMIADLKTLNAELLLLSSEPFPFRPKHVEELQKELAGVKIILVDGELFSWYGSRLLKSPAYFEELQIQFLSLDHATGA